ncbi:GumC domain-containing protein [Flammeovirga kamogawensis]|uniref:Lipoprotein n=1 Tax=Flammeovirga kamogawensis TaxID=373891 RepID=A0ABX8H0F3_9BACT|nr:hypothetical protein [Flammeovirga kamogawensis]MBB6462230.1 hypothetical protein [Flammeovirga kamogawensis]QWG09369.1 hypothetical protein KM029_22445 [Flammeovirga kamogawensis]TRX64889.1 hypothetical protein EO216_20360 [Flammeovirga kamogawensis]
MKKILIPILLLSATISCNKKDSEITPVQENEKSVKKEEQLKVANETEVEKAQKMLEKAKQTSKEITQKEIAAQEQLKKADEAIQKAKKEASQADSSKKKEADEKVIAAEKKKEELLKVTNNIKKVAEKSKDAIKTAEKALEIAKKSEETKSKIASEKDDEKVKELKLELEKDKELADKTKLLAKELVDGVDKELNVELSDIKTINKENEEALKKYEDEMRTSLAETKALYDKIKKHTDIIEVESNKTNNYNTLNDVPAFKKSVEVAKQNAVNLSTYFNEMVVIKDKMHNEAYNHTMYGTEREIIERTEELRNNLEKIKQIVDDAEYYIRQSKSQISSMESYFSTFESNLNTQKNRKLKNLQEEVATAKRSLKSAIEGVDYQKINIRKLEVKIINHNSRIKQFEDRIKQLEELLKNQPADRDGSNTKNEIKELRNKIIRENNIYDENSIRSNIATQKSYLVQLEKELEDAKKLVAIREQELQQLK